MVYLDGELVTWADLERDDEAPLMAKVKKLAVLYGFRYYHTRNSRRSDEGYPDVTMVKGGRLIYAELKSKTGTVDPEQWEWLRDLAAADAETYVWRPAELQEIAKVLAR